MAAMKSSGAFDRRVCQPRRRPFVDEETEPAVLCPLPSARAWTAPLGALSTTTSMVFSRAAWPQPARYGDGARLVQRMPKLPPEHQRANPRCGCGINHRAERAFGHGSHEGTDYGEQRGEEHDA